MQITFKKYLQELKPTVSGVKALALCLLVVPLIADIVFLVAQTGRKREMISASIPLFNAYLKALPVYLLYLLAFYLVLNIWKTSFDIIKEKLNTRN